MYEVRVVKGDNRFTINEICCENSAQQIAWKWIEMGYLARVVKLDK